MAATPPRRPGLWVEIALTLALITLATILLNAGVYWLLIKTTETGRRTDLAQAVVAGLAGPLDAAAEGGRLDAPRVKAALQVYVDRGLELEELWVSDAALVAVAAPVGAPPGAPDLGVREALYGRVLHTELSGELWGERSVTVTAPVAPEGRVVGVVRVRMPMKGTPVPGGPAAFVLGYTAFSGVAIGIFGFVLLRRRLIGPIREVQAATERIADGDFGHTVSVDAARELAELSASLNSLSASLASFRARTAEQVERLEAANAELKTAQEALVRSERLASVGRLAAGMAHEVGNPLSAVLGYIELLRADASDPGLVADLLARCDKELSRIHRIIQQLLGEARQDGAPVQPIAPADVLDEVGEAVGHRARRQGVRLVLDADDPLPRVRIHAERLHQVLLNVALNALEALREDPPDDPEVRLEARVDGDEVWIEVTDNGPGFADVALDRAFEPFFTTRDVGKGTGLGLSTSLEIVRQAGGRMEVGNHLDGGAWVAVALPAEPPEAADG